MNVVLTTRRRVTGTTPVPRGPGPDRRRRPTFAFIMGPVLLLLLLLLLRPPDPRLGGPPRGKRGTFARAKLLKTGLSRGLRRL